MDYFTLFMDYLTPEANIFNKKAGKALVRGGVSNAFPAI